MLKFSKTNSHATLADATEPAPATDKRLLVTDIAGSSDKDGAILLVIQDVAGTPVTLFELQVGADKFAHAFETPLLVAKGKSATVRIDGTAVCKANIVGITKSA